MHQISVDCIIYAHTHNSLFLHNPRIIPTINCKHTTAALQGILSASILLIETYCYMISHHSWEHSPYCRNTDTNHENCHNSVHSHVNLCCTHWYLHVESNIIELREKGRKERKRVQKHRRRVVEIWKNCNCRGQLDGEEKGKIIPLHDPFLLTLYPGSQTQIPIPLASVSHL